MGKNLISQRRGRGTARFRAPSFRYAGSISHKQIKGEVLAGKVTDFITSQGHSAPLATVKYDNGDEGILLASDGLLVGDEIAIGASAPAKTGNTLPLKKIPEGTLIYNIENRPGDGGKFVRSSGGAARVVAKLNNAIIVSLPSKKEKLFNPECLATIGVVSGGGRKEKPFLKAGNKHHAKRKKNKFFPKVKGLSMNAIDHPHGGSRSLRKGRPTTAPKNAPPGRKVGMIRARRTGRKKGGK